LAHFSKLKTGFGPFLFGFCDICVRFVETKIGFGPKKVGFGPVSFSKVGQLKPSDCNGFSRFGPLSHFFLLLIVIKKLINIYNRANKSGLLAQAI
jgi:hypothetical protein